MDKNTQKEIIKSNLKFGKKNALTREQLTLLIGANDRHTRALIQELREEGVIIISSSQTKGYYYPSNKQEAEQFVHEMEKRGKRCMYTCKQARQWIKNNENQLEIDFE